MLLERRGECFLRFIVSTVMVRKPATNTAIRIAKVGVSGIGIDPENTIDTLFVLK